MGRKSCHDDSMMTAKGVTKGIRKALVGGDQRVAACGRKTQDRIIGGRTETDLPDVIGVMTLLAEGRDDRSRQIGIHEEPDQRLATLTSSSAMTVAA